MHYFPEILPVFHRLPGGASGKELTANAGDFFCFPDSSVGKEST